MSNCPLCRHSVMSDATWRILSLLTWSSGRKDPRTSRRIVSPFAHTKH